MSLAQVLYPPQTTRGWDEWTFAHLAHHQAIINAAASKGKGTLLMYQIYPFDRDDAEGWLLQHQEMHDQMNALYGVNGVDLSTLDFSKKADVDAWLSLNYLEHQDVAQRCGVSI